MRRLFQAIQPPGQKATVAALRSQLLSWVLQENVQTLNHILPLRQVSAPDRARKPTS